MKLGSRNVKIAAIALVVSLVASSIGFLYLVNQGSASGGPYQKWSISDDPDLRTPWLHYISNGMIIGSSRSWASTTNEYHQYLFAMDLNGSLLWKARVNTTFISTQMPGVVYAAPFPILGPEGTIYYADYLAYANEGESGSFSPGGKITSLNIDGTVRWDYVVDNGSLSLLSVYPDGMVMASHMVDHYDVDQTTLLGSSANMVALSDEGVELWRVELPLQLNHSFTGPTIATDGSFVVTAYNDTDAFSIAFNKSTGSAIISPVDYHYFTSWSKGTNKNGTVQYEVRQEEVNDSTTVDSLYALNTSDGRALWHTVLRHGDNPDHLTSGGYSSMAADVDGNGVVLCQDFHGGSRYALDKDGNILWQKKESWFVSYGYPSGGFMLWDMDNNLIKIDSEGNVVWRYHSPYPVYSPPIMGGDGTIYYTTTSTICAIAPPSG